MADDYAPPAVSSTKVLTVLRGRLASSRERDEPFGEAWLTATKFVLATQHGPARREWRICLERTRSTWERCYERVPATHTEVAIATARTLINREPLPDSACAECGKPTSDRAQYCTPCKRSLEPASGKLGAVGPRQQPNLATVVEEDWSQLELVA